MYDKAKVEPNFQNPWRKISGNAPLTMPTIRNCSGTWQPIQG